MHGFVCLLVTVTGIICCKVTSKPKLPDSVLLSAGFAAAHGRCLSYNINLPKINARLCQLSSMLTGTHSCSIASWLRTVPIVCFQRQTYSACAVTLVASDTIIVLVTYLHSM